MVKQIELGTHQAIRPVPQTWKVLSMSVNFDGFGCINLNFPFALSRMLRLAKRNLLKTRGSR